jgi:Homeodomain-like domain
VLVELSVMERRYRAVLEAEAGVPVTEVAARYGVTRQSVHAVGAPLLLRRAGRIGGPFAPPGQLPAPDRGRGRGGGP